jgi:hypothetical protein
MRHLCALALLVSTPALADNPPQPHVDLVIALDVSGSMRGLLDATRAKLWDVVRLLGRAQPQPVVRVGLITFGGKYYSPADGWVRREMDLTTDLDAVSEHLFSLAVRGSQEYVARAVQTAARDLSWDQDPKALKILFVAGNESAEQDPVVSLASALGEARRRGILVNTIYCGRPDEREAPAWRKVAALGGGEFAAIDHQKSQLAQATPYDTELGRLSRALTTTYVGYGARGAGHHAVQAAEDERAAAQGPQVAAARAAAKASSAYNNDQWDAVDAFANHKPLGSLPSSLSHMNDGERSAWLKARLAEREELQQRIRTLSSRRDAYLSTPPSGATGAPPAATATPAPPSAPVAVSEPMSKPAKRPKHASPASMDDAFVGTVRKQAIMNGLGL